MKHPSLQSVWKHPRRRRVARGGLREGSRGAHAPPRTMRLRARAPSDGTAALSSGGAAPGRFPRRPSIQASLRRDTRARETEMELPAPSSVHVGVARHCSHVWARASRPFSCFWRGACLAAVAHCGGLVVWWWKIRCTIQLDFAQAVQDGRFEYPVQRKLTCHGQLVSVLSPGQGLQHVPDKLSANAG